MIRSLLACLALLVIGVLAIPVELPYRLLRFVLAGEPVELRVVHAALSGAVVVWLWRK